MLDKAEMIRLYDEGLSARQVGERLGCSHTRVLYVLRSVGHVRSRSDAARLAHPVTSKTLRATRFMARKIYTRAFGPVPEGCHIHHIDGDHTNNDPENLEAVPAHMHRNQHFRERYAQKADT